MNSAALEFSQELYLEHFSEVSFLYESRSQYLHSDKLQWHELEEDEKRIEAHLDALVIGETHALTLILSLCKDGELHAFYLAACLYCRHRDIRGLFKFFTQLNHENLAELHAVRDGLIQEWPNDWFSSLEHYPFEEFPYLIPVFLPLFANRRQPIDLRLYKLAINDGLLEPYECLKAARRLSSSHCLPKESWVATEDDSAALIQEKSLCLLQMTDSTRQLNYFQKWVPEHKIPYCSIALGAGKLLAQQICDPVEALSLDRVLAIGLIGLPEYTPLLIKYLDNEALAPTAALALHTITGAALVNDVFIEEDWQENELFEDELEAFRQGKVPQHPAGRPYGEREQVLSLNPQHWSYWLEHYQDRFQTGLRYRLGYPVTPRALIYALYHPHTRRLIRYLSYEELVLRYKTRIAFNSDDWVTKQNYAIAAMNQWAETVDNNFQPGAWYLQGKLMTTDNPETLTKSNATT